MKIVYIQTGGTIDKDYPRGETDHGYGFEITSPATQSIISESFTTFDYEIVSVLKKDSLDITDEDRQKIYDLVSHLPDTQIVITHGTDTILQTAEKLS
jgi:L-asparaginase